MEELLNIYDYNLNITGVLPRSEVHQNKYLHAVIHLWLVDLESNHIYFQKRAANKKSFPNYYDIAVAGHIEASELPILACQRETREEINLDLNLSEIVFLGAIIEHFEHESELAYVFVTNQYQPKLSLSEEVSEIITVDINDYLANHKPSPLCPHNDSLIINYLKNSR